MIWSGEIINRRKDGSLYSEATTITPYLDQNGEIMRFISIKQDITELAEARDYVAAYDAALAHGRGVIVDD